MTAKPSLNPKQSRFVLEYMIDHNATQAAIRAGYSEKTAPEQGCRLFNNVNVQAAISEKTVKQAEKLGLSADRVIAGLMAEADGTMEDSTPASRVAAWTALGKHLKMFTEKVELSGDVAIRQLSDEELIAKRDAILARIGAKIGG